MLASLLRRMIFIQAAAGAILGFLLHRLAGTTPWSSLVGALLVPILLTFVASLVTGLMSRSQGPLVPWLRAMWGEFCASVLIFLLRQPWTVEAPSAQAATGTAQRIPVVLVHGYLCNHRVWDTVAQGLRAQGHTVLAVNLEPLFTSIEKYVLPIEMAVMDLCQQTGASQVALVGHSMGGLAIRAWMRACGVDRVARVLTLGTPHAGTQIAPRTRTPNGKQMCWHSTWLTALAASETDAVRARMRIAITPQDNIVYPQRDQVLPGVETTVFNGIGHLQMCLDASVRQWVGKELSGLSPQTQGATE